VSSQTPLATITSTGEAGEIEGGCFCSNVSFMKIYKSTLMNSKSLGFTKTGHNVVQDSPATQVSSQTPIATIMSTSEAGKIEGGCVCSIVSFLKVKQSSLKFQN